MDNATRTRARVRCEKVRSPYAAGGRKRVGVVRVDRPLRPPHGRGPPRSRVLEIRPWLIKGIDRLPVGPGNAD